MGDYAAPGSSTCTSCLTLGQFDDDRDPSTPCSDTDICLQVCAAGTQDDDCDEATACVACESGTYAAGGSFPEFRCVDCDAGSSDDDSDASTECIDCLAGYYAEVGNYGACIGCASGRFAPTDGGTSEASCEGCQAGQFSDAGSSSCSFCTAGQADVDSDASTPCSDCAVGTYAGCGATSCDLEITPPGPPKVTRVIILREQLIRSTAVKAGPDGNVVRVLEGTAAGGTFPHKYGAKKKKKGKNPRYDVSDKGPDEDGNYDSYVIVASEFGPDTSNDDDDAGSTGVQDASEQKKSSRTGRHPTNSLESLSSIGVVPKVAGDRMAIVAPPSVLMT